MTNTEINIDKTIFRAYDIRGKTPMQLNANVALLIGKALATTAVARGVSSITVGYDGRLTSPDLAAALIEGINSIGVDTIDLGMVATPIAYWAAAQKTDGSSAVITGSHNPQEYNGIKMALDGIPLAGEEVQHIREIVESGRFAAAGMAGIREKFSDATDGYAKSILEEKPLARKVKIVVDCGNGAAGPTYPSILEKLGCEVISIFDEVDGTFPNHHPDPAVPKNFEQAVKVMHESNAEMVLAFDGDGDRLGIWLPEKGILYPDRLTMLLAKQLLEKQPGAKILYDVKCSVNLAKFVKELGGEPILCRTGHSFMKKALAETGAPFGGELSGHIFFNEAKCRYDDPLLAATRLLQLVAQSESADILCQSVPDSCATPEYTVPIEGTTPHAFVDELTKRGGLANKPTLITIDGIRAEWDDSFGLVRASNTTNSLVIRFEGVDKTACDKAQEAFREIIIALAPKLDLPF